MFNETLSVRVFECERVVYLARDCSVTILKECDNEGTDNKVMPACALTGCGLPKLCEAQG